MAKIYGIEHLDDPSLRFFDEAGCAKLFSFIVYDPRLESYWDDMNTAALVSDITADHRIDTLLREEGVNNGDSN